MRLRLKIRGTRSDSEQVGDPDRQRRQRRFKLPRTRGRRLVLYTVVLAAGALVGVGGLLKWTEHRPALPGELGCRMIEVDRSRWECLGDQYAKWVNTDERVRRLARMDKEVLLRSKASTDCHEGMHYAARKLVREDGVDPLDLLDHADGSSNCTRGLQHGLMEATVEDDPAAFGEILAELCYQSGDAVERFNCFHGAGHTYVTTLGDSIEAGADKCRSLPRERDVDGCLDGAFMEYTDHLPGYDDPLEGFSKGCEFALPNELARCAVQATGAFKPELGIDTDEELRELCFRLKNDLAMSGCIGATIISADSNLVPWCAEHVSGAARQAHCALAAGVQSGDLDDIEAMDRECRRQESEAIRFGCGAAIGSRRFLDPNTPDPGRADVPRIRRKCATLERRFQDGCVAGLLQCWPRLGSQTFVEGRPLWAVCQAMLGVTAPYQLRVAGEIAPSQYEPDFNAWYRELERRKGPLPFAE